MPAVIINLNFANLKEAEDLLDSLEPEIEVDLLALYREGGENITERASELAPKKTGFMASLIGFVVIARGVTIMGGADYTSYQEFGTRLITPKYFITTAIDEIMPEIDAQAEEIIGLYLEREANKINAIGYEPIDLLVSGIG